MRPKLRTLIVDVYRDVSYALDDDGYTAAEYQDLVRKRFVKAWEGLIDGYKVNACDTGSHLARGAKSSVGHFHRIELPTVLRPRTRRNSEALGKGSTQLKVYRGTSPPLASERFLKGDDSWAQYGSTEICVQLRRISLPKLPSGMLARSSRDCSRSLPFLTSIVYVGWIRLKADY